MQNNIADLELNYCKNIFIDSSKDSFLEYDNKSYFSKTPSCKSYCYLKCKLNDFGKDHDYFKKNKISMDSLKIKIISSHGKSVFSKISSESKNILKHTINMEFRIIEYNKWAFFLTKIRLFVLRSKHLFSNLSNKQFTKNTKPENPSKLCFWFCHQVYKFTVTVMFVIFLFMFLNGIRVYAGSPTHNYAPGPVNCPSGVSLVRVGNSISDSEITYVEERHKKHIHKNLVNFFDRIAIPEFNVPQFFNPDGGSMTTLGIGLGVSGGGFRAMLTGAGALSAMDIRTPGSTEPGQIGGLLQSMSYISGLSGGAWLIGSVFMQNMPTIQHITSPDGPWQLEFNPITGERKNKNVFNINLEYEILKAFSINDNTASSTLTREIEENNLLEKFRIDHATVLDKKPFNNVKQPLDHIKQYYSLLYEEVAPKKAAGFALSITDFWARSLSRAFLAKNVDISTSWSDIVELPRFKSHEMPYPILIANAVVPKVLADANSSTIIEMSPYEFGSWSPTINAFAPMKYIGTELFDGKIVTKKDGTLSCIEGFDNLSFIIATSSSLFNDLAAMGMRHLDGFPQVRSVITKYKQLMNILNANDNKIKNNIDYALYSPNPFQGFHQGITLPAPADIKKGVDNDLIRNIKEHGNAYTTSDTLYIVDGGEDDLNVPLDPLLRPERKLDMVIALDVSLDKGSKPNGTSIFKGTWRYHGKEDIHRVSFPIIPTPETFIKSGANLGPVFFGCDLEKDYLKPELHGSNLPLFKYLKGQFETLLPKPPLIVYMPNHVVSYDSQQPTTRLIYSENDMKKMIQNGHDMFTQKNTSRWASCLGCSMIHRETVRRGEKFPVFCQGCFEEYCYKYSKIADKLM